ncbi:MAG: hypothetical protein A2138_12750 [Deltaproteobacteria bacterium RBG_16_71_12]|nr:MAG: hypothetical protein A2138_12750 [Deltaproteobacteria bacterium RBG_16_71_12]
MRYLRTFALALPVALAAACGPLEGDADWVAAEQAEVARVLPDVAEPSPPGAPGDGLATPTPIEDPTVAYMRDLTLPSPAEEEQLAPDEEGEQGADGEGDGRGAR